MASHAGLFGSINDVSKWGLLLRGAYLEKNKEPYFRNINWLKIASLTKKYTFENGVSELSNRWTDAQKDLKLISTQSETINNEIHYTATIQNVSDKRYCFTQYGQIAP